MEVTERSVKDFLLPETKFQEPDEKPERNGINFKASLKFFQEQFFTNESKLQSSGEESLNPQKKSEFRSIPIQIPTVDTILESVRVLRAIQKSEQERCPLSATSASLEQTSEFNEAEAFTNLEASCDTHPNSENELCSFWPSVSLENDQQTNTKKLSTSEKHFKNAKTKEDETESYVNEEKGHEKLYYSLQEGLDLNHPCVRTNSLELIEDGTTNFEQYKIEDNDLKLVKKQKLKNNTCPIDAMDSLENDLFLDESFVKDNSANMLTCEKTENQISALPNNSTEVNSKNFLLDSTSCCSLDKVFQSSLELNTVLGDVKATGSEKLNALQSNDDSRPEKLQEIEETKCDSSENISEFQELIRKEKYLRHDEETSLISSSEYEVDTKEKMKSHFELSGASCSSQLNLSKDESLESSLTAKQSSTDLLSITESLYNWDENPEYQVMTRVEMKFEEKLFVLSKGTFCEYPADYYVISIEDSILKISENSHVLVSLNMKYGRISIRMGSILEIDNMMGRWIHIRYDNEAESLKNQIESHCLKHWQTDCIQLVHYPLKSHQNVVIIDLGSCSTRAGILMDQPTLPSLFFPTICAADKQTGTCIYGMDALKPEVRKQSVILFPVRPSNKITKHTIDIDLLGGLFQKIFDDLKINPAEYIVQICLPRSLSLNTQIALVKLVLEDLKVKAVCLTSQALLTLYAHDVNTAIAVDIGERLDVLPVVDGFIVEKGVTRFPHGGQRLIHHMNQSLAEKRITLSNDIDSFVIQYIIKNLAYVAEDYNSEMGKATRHRNMIQKTVTLQSTLSDASSCKSIALEEARFQVPEGLFNPGLWGLDSPGIHHLVQKAITATDVDARKRIAQNIYLSGGVTMLPGFAERLNKELAKLSKLKILPKVTASNYRYHCTFIGACKFAKLEVFPQVCVNLEEYSQNATSALKKWALF